MKNDKKGNDIAMFFHDLSRVLSFNEQQLKSTTTWKFENLNNKERWVME